MKNKIEKIIGGFGVLIGYKQGDYYLWKRHSLGNAYYYILTKRNDLKNATEKDIRDALASNEAKMILSFIKGKEKLEKLNNNEVAFENIPSFI